MLAPSWWLIEGAIGAAPYHLMIAAFVVWAMRLLLVRPRIARKVLLAILIWCVGFGVTVVFDEVARIRMASIPYEPFVVVVTGGILYIIGWCLIMRALYEQYGTHDPDFDLQRQEIHGPV
jgi:hypothetical protein